MSNRTKLPLLFMACVCFSHSSHAQEARVVENPLQEEFEYRVGTLIQPAISVDEMLWRALQFETKKGKELISGKDISTTLSLEYENTGESKGEVLTIILLEDERGRQLGRIEAGTLKVGAGKTKDQKKKLKMDGGVLARTRKLWVFVEVTRE